jgi:sulfur carrier protein
MNLVVNGEGARVADGCTVLALVETRLESTRGVAVAVNAEVVPKSSWPSHVLVNGDRVEVLTAARGG